MVQKCRLLQISRWVPIMAFGTLVVMKLRSSPIHFLYQVGRRTNRRCERCSSPRKRRTHNHCGNLSRRRSVLSIDPSILALPSLNRGCGFLFHSVGRPKSFDRPPGTRRSYTDGTISLPSLPPSAHWCIGVTYLFFRRSMGS